MLVLLTGKPLSSAANKDNIKEVTEIITEPEKVNNRAWEMVKSARDELLILFSSANAFARQERIGGLELLKQLCAMKKELQIKGGFKSFFKFWT